MTTTLIRHAYLPNVTLGTLYVGGISFATLEEGWKRDPDGPGGQRREPGLVESCIPDGLYNLKPHTSAKYPNGVYALVNPILGVYYAPDWKPPGQKWGRDAILIHTGNNTDHIEGCILVGRKHAFIEGRWNVLESKVAFADLKSCLGEKPDQIHIRPTAGTSEIL